MGKADLDAVYAIEKACFGSPWSKRSLSDELSNDLAYYCVLHLNNQPIGYAGLWSFLDEAHITKIAVLKEYRGKGLGKMLMLHMMDEARKRNAERMTLEVRERNVAAQALYQGLGFRREGIRRGYYSDTGESAYILWLDL